MKYYGAKGRPIDCRTMEYASCNDETDGLTKYSYDKDSKRYSKAS